MKIRSKSTPRSKRNALEEKEETYREAWRVKNTFLEMLSENKEEARRSKTHPTGGKAGDGEDGKESTSEEDRDDWIKKNILYTSLVKGKKDTNKPGRNYRIN